MITLFLADDHQLVRKALKTLLEAEVCFQVVGEAGNGADTIELVEKLKPEILLLDLSIPKVHGLDVIRYITENTKTKVLVVSMFSSECYVLEALKNGARGYIVKDSAPDQLIAAIKQVAAGQTYLGDNLPQNEMLKLIGGKRSSEESLASLTRKEKIVLQLAAEGQSSNQIAQHLNLSPRTIESHRASLMRKLKFKNQTDIVRFAIRKSLIAA
ncbi:MAG: response regulator [Verrucomicrobiales bacterium]